MWVHIGLEVVNLVLHVHDARVIESRHFPGRNRETSAADDSVEAAV